MKSVRITGKSTKIILLKENYLLFDFLFSLNVIDQIIATANSDEHTWPDGFVVDHFLIVNYNLKAIII